jgi:diguanylate cyclase (GGDEF)-like protein/PAS domain S-box-containing protein
MRPVSNTAGPRFPSPASGSDTDYRELIERIPAVSYTAEFGANCAWLFVSPQVENLLGFKVEEWYADPQLWFRQIHPDDRDTVIALEERTRREGVPFSCEYRLLDRHGEEVWVRDDAVVMVDEDGRQLLQGLMLDISEQKRAESRLLYLADHDSLTGLFNRRRFFQELDGYLAWSERHGDPGAVLLLDMDGLKQINDSFGHEAGDELLRRTADVLRGRLRETDVLARLGGDEFVVLLRSLPARAATQMASELIALISRQRIALSDATIRPRASIGLALIEPGSGLDADSLVRLADASMYEFKSLTATGSASRAAVTSNGRRADAADELEADLDEALAAIGVELREGIRLRAEVGRRYGRVMPRFVSSLLAEAEAAALRALQRLKRAQAVSEEMRA